MNLPTCCCTIFFPSPFFFFFFRQVDFHGRQLDLWINITVFVFLFFFLNPHKKNCCEHSWKCSVMIVFMPLFPYDIADTRIKRKEGRFWNVWFRVRARSLYSVWPHLFFIFSGLRHTDLLPPPTYFLFFFLKKGPQIAGGIVSILPLPYDSRNIKRKKDLKKCFLSRDVRGQALEMQSAEIGNALSPSLVCTWKGLQVSTCLAPGRHAIGPTVI